MISVRLPKELETKINILVKKNSISKSEIIKQALTMYLNENEKKEESSFELGKNLFGKYGSGDRNLSTQYKEKVKKIINEKYTN